MSTVAERLPEAPVVDLDDPDRYCHSHRSLRAETAEPTTSGQIYGPTKPARLYLGVDVSLLTLHGSDFEGCQSF